MYMHYEKKTWKMGKVENKERKKRIQKVLLWSFPPYAFVESSDAI